MNNDPATCPKCGGAIPADAPQGLCPRCVLAGVAAPTEVTRTTGPRVAAPPIESVRAAFPQLEILELIGQGGMGVVYKARQPKLDRLVALKILSGSLATDPTFEERFTREARTLAKLSHANIVTIYDHGRAGEFFYLLMEFVDGVNLRQAMAAGRFTASEALALVPRICEALQYAHEEGVLHRDIKPENILLDGRGRVKLADFGIAKMLGEAQPGGTLTASGASLGTPHYMSPEQIEHPSDVDHRTDIFSLGVVFYEMLTGELPLGRFGPPSAKSAVDRRVDEIVFRTLEKERELRQQSAGEVKTQLDTLSRTAAPSAHDPQPAGNRTPRILKGQGCILIRPETMTTFDGQLFAYQNRGQLLLDEERLTFTKDGFPTVIPLSAITDLSIGQYPRSMNPAGINLISLNYTDGTTDKRVYLSPMDGWFGFPSTWNRHVADWHSAIREAVAAATGKPPGETPAYQLGIPGGKGIGLLRMLMPAIVIAFSLGVITTLTFKGGGLAGTPELLLVFLAVLIPLLFVYNHRRRGPHLDGGVTPTKNRFGWIRALLLILFLFGSVFLAIFAVYRQSAREPLVALPKPASMPVSVTDPQSTPIDSAAPVNFQPAGNEIDSRAANQTSLELMADFTATPVTLGLLVTAAIGALFFLFHKPNPDFASANATGDPANPPVGSSTGPRLSALFNLWKSDGSVDVWKLVAWAVFAWVGTQLIGALSLLFGAGFGLLASAIRNGPFTLAISGLGALVLGEITVGAGFPFGRWRHVVKRSLTALKVGLVLMVSLLIVSRIAPGSGDFLPRLLVRIGLAAAVAGIWLLDRRRWPDAKTHSAVVVVPMLCLGLIWGRFLPHSIGGSGPRPPTMAMVTDTPHGTAIPASPALIASPIVSAPTAQAAMSVEDIELKVAKQQLEKTLNELADAKMELGTSGDMLAVTESHPAKKALLERLLCLEERFAILRKELRAGSANPEAGDAVVREVELGVARDQYEKTLTALAEAKKQLATAPAMLSNSDNFPPKKALLTKIQFLEERRAVLTRELSSAQSKAPTKP